MPNQEVSTLNLGIDFDKLLRRFLLDGVPVYGEHGEPIMDGNVHRTVVIDAVWARVISDRLKTKAVTKAMAAKGDRQPPSLTTAFNDLHSKSA